MKKKVDFLWLTLGFVLAFAFILTLVKVSESAEREVGAGENIYKITKELDQRVECLQYMNGFSGNKIRAGKNLSYISKEDLAYALAFAEYYVLGMTPDNPDFNYFMKIIENIESGKIKCASNQNGIEPSEIFVLADAERAY